jgi:hypothetical protein
MLMRVLVLCMGVLVSATIAGVSNGVAQMIPVVSQPTIPITPTQAPATTFVYRSLVDLSPPELAQYALDFALTGREIRIVSGVPEARLARPIFARELAPLGLPDLRNPDNDPPLVMAVLRGNFAWYGPLQYVAFIFDAREGDPVRIWGSPDGAHFRYVLNDASLPEAPYVRPATPQPRVPGGIVRVEMTLPPIGTRPPTMSPTPTLNPAPTALPTPSAHSSSGSTW